MIPDAARIDEAVVAATTAFLEALYGAFRAIHDVVGFKEVRYGREELALLRACFPSMRLLLLVGDPVSTWKSICGFGRSTFGDERYRDAQRFAESWACTVREYIDWSRDDPQSALIVHDRLVAQEPETIEQVCRVAQVSHATLLDVLAHRIWSDFRVTPPPIDLERPKRIRSGFDATRSGRRCGRLGRRAQLHRAASCKTHDLERHV